MSRAGFIFPVCDLLGFLHLWITVLSVLENSQLLPLQTIPFSHSPSKTLKCMFDFVTFLSLFSICFNLSSIFSSSFSLPKTSMDKRESCKHGWSVSDTSNMWSLGGSVMCISAGAHSWYLVFLCTCYLLLYAALKNNCVDLPRQKTKVPSSREGLHLSLPGAQGAARHFQFKPGGFTACD